MRGGLRPPHAQHDLADSALDVPGERSHRLEDYLYVSLGVATTLGATEVSVTSPRMRRVVNVHVVLTFLDNSVIVALLAAILVR